MSDHVSKESYANRSVNAGLRSPATSHQQTTSVEPVGREGTSSQAQVVVDDEKETTETRAMGDISPQSHTAQTQAQASPNITTSPKSSLRNDLEDDARFVCNICLDPVKDAVVTVCGHLYCWPCLFRWLNIGHTTCPVCKAGVTKDNVIPLYLQGGDEDPRVKHSSSTGGSSNSNGGSVPNRPSAQRPVPQPNTTPGQAGGGMGGGMAFSAGLGFFPSLFGLQFQNFAPPPPVNNANNRALTPEEIQQNFVSQSLLMLGIFVLFCLLLV